MQNIALSNSINIYYEKNRIFDEFLNLSRNQLNSINKSNYFKEFLDSGNEDKAKDLFLAIARSSHDIMQLRYIDKDGNCIINKLIENAIVLEKNDLAKEYQKLQKTQLPECNKKIK